MTMVKKIQYHFRTVYVIGDVLPMIRNVDILTMIAMIAEKTMPI